MLRLQIKLEGKRCSSEGEICSELREWGLKIGFKSAAKSPLRISTLVIFRKENAMKCIFCRKLAKSSLYILWTWENNCSLLQAFNAHYVHVINTLYITGVVSSLKVNHSTHLLYRPELISVNMYVTHTVQLPHHNKPGSNAAKDNIYKPGAKK